jgi:DNA topoisomerase II
VFRNNMTNKGEPQISACKATENWTCVTFKPDLAKFGMARLEDDTVALMRKRVYDMAGVLGKSVKARRGRSWLAARSARRCQLPDARLASRTARWRPPCRNLKPKP